MILVICAEKVDNDCSMLCSSPISTSTRLKTDSSLLSAHGTRSPHIAIRVSKPSVLSVTVLPPVFGPVITSVSKDFPSTMSTGTTLSLSISGCLACLMSTTPLSFITGIDAFIEYARSALAKIRLRFARFS